MTLICPECKNDVDLSAHERLEPEAVVECNHCGITLGVVKVGEGGEVEAEIIEEGK